MNDISHLQKAVQEEGHSGWLFSNYKHRDELSDRLLGLSRTTVNTRPWYYLIPKEGAPVKIIHAIEQDTLVELPGEPRVYGSLEEVKHIFSSLPLPPSLSDSKDSRPRLALQFSANLPVLSYTDHGTALLVEEAGYSTVSSEVLVQRVVSLLDPLKMQSHERAAKHLYEIVETAWNFLCRAYRERTSEIYREGDVQTLIVREFEKRGLVTDHPPIVSAGVNTANPHYAPSPEAPGRSLQEGDIIQFDLWAKERGENAIYADISWVGKWGGTPTETEENRFQALREARDLAVSTIAEGAAREKKTTGYSVDLKLREFFREAGCERLLKHRTGHGIDREVHGWGVNLDSTEFPDHRPILEGSCFSVEPGLYGDGFGMRTEINVYILDGTPKISGKAPQESILLV